jgi:hypothetical protein
MDTTSLIVLVSRMEMLGTDPKDIYAELAKKIDPHLALTGRTRSQETRDRIAAARTKYWAARRAAR